MSDEKQRLKKQMAETQKKIAASKRRSAAIKHRKDPGDRPKTHRLKRDSASSRGKVTSGPSKSRIKVINKPQTRSFRRVKQA